MAPSRRGKSSNVPDSRSTTGRFTSDASRRDPLIHQVIRARRSVDAARRAQNTSTGDPAKLALVERAKQWVHDPPQGQLPA
jgi:hypothetical protein